MNAFHRSQVDHKTTIDGRAPRDVVATSLDCHFEIQLSGDPHSVSDIGHACASSDHCWPFVH
jgi:hypothetical protein